MTQHTKNIVRSLGALIAVTAVVASACGSDSVPEQASIDQGSTVQEASAEGLRDFTANFKHVDYDPLKSPKSALLESDAVVSGTIIAVDRGMEIWVPNIYGECKDDSAVVEAKQSDCILKEEIVWGTYASVDIEVDRVISGTAPTKVTVQIGVPMYDVEGGIAAIPIGKQVLLVLGEETGWRPSDDSDIRWPGDRAEEQIWFIHPGGFFVEGSGGRAVGIFANEQEVARAWGLESVKIRDFELALINAAKQRS